MTQSPAYFSRYLDEKFPGDGSRSWGLSLLNSDGNLRSSMLKNMASNDSSSPHETGDEHSTRGKT